MTYDWMERTGLLLGEEKLDLLRQAHVLVVGVGGVGASAAEMIARAGVGRMTLADADTVSPSNINRQLVALHSTVGRPKVEVLAERLRDINPRIEVHAVNEYIRDEATARLLDAAHYDYVVDAVDTVSAKIALVACPWSARWAPGPRRTPRSSKSTTSAARTTARWPTCSANGSTRRASARDSAPYSRPNPYARGR